MSGDCTPSYLIGPEECEAFLSAFEDGSLPADEWTHRAHIAMATVYLARYGDAVVPHTRAAIRNYLHARGKAITHYHETLTIFWLEIISEALREQRGVSQHESVCRNCGRFGSQSKLHEHYYSFDVFNSPNARGCWVPPDLLPLRISFSTQA